MYKLWDVYNDTFPEITKGKKSIFSSVIFAYLNIGLILLLHLDQYYEAIRQFTNAIEIDPLNVRAYLCRAQAYHKVICSFHFCWLLNTALFIFMVVQCILIFIAWYRTDVRTYL